MLVIEDMKELAPMVQSAVIYTRRNGALGASCDGVQDTGYHIEENCGFFTVYEDGGDIPLIRNATRAQAEAAIAEDWRKK